MREIPKITLGKLPMVRENPMISQENLVKMRENPVFFRVFNKQLIFEQENIQQYLYFFSVILNQGWVPLASEGEPLARFVFFDRSLVRSLAPTFASARSLAARSPLARPSTPARSPARRMGPACSPLARYPFAARLPPYAASVFPFC